MQRQQDVIAESTIRLFLLGLLLGLITILLSCYYTVQSFASDKTSGFNDNVKELNEAIRAVDGPLVSKYLTEMNASGLPRDFEAGQHPLYVVTCIPEEETTEAQEMVRLVAHTFRIVPFDVDYTHHPLTAAYRHHRYKVAKILLEVWRQFPPSLGSPMGEVYGSALSVAELRAVDPSVVIYCESRDVVRCRNAVDGARVRTTPTSQLEGAYLLRFGAPQTPPPHIPFRDADMPGRVIAPPSTVRAGFWDDPFRPAVPDLLPPRGSLVVNPGYFSDPAEQLLYMFFGHVEGSTVLSGFVVFALSVTAFCLTLWAIGVTVWMVRSA
jgi:hypothetical protein